MAPASAPDSPPRVGREQGQDDVAQTLQKLHMDELPGIVRTRPVQSNGWKTNPFMITLLVLREYFRFLWATWTDAFWALMMYPTTIWDRISIVVLAVGASIIISIALPWCIFSNMPWVVSQFTHWSGLSASGLSLTNAIYPKIFSEMSPELLALSKQMLSKPPSEVSGLKGDKRIFQLDIAKLLLQCAALMYEKSSESTKDALSIVKEGMTFFPNVNPAKSEYSAPGQRITEAVGRKSVANIYDSLHGDGEATIQQIAKHLGLEFQTVSELNSAGSAYCGLFWDPNDTFVIVAFRGTSPTDFTEWVTDFTFQPQRAGTWLRGFGRVHRGFLRKIFPTKISPGSKIPYDTINEAISAVADRLLCGKSPETRINLWITGHSLGCALASVYYSRLVNENKPRKTRCVVRDAYLFAAPIVCEPTSVEAFNNAMNQGDDEDCRTMWRIINGKDIVATGLPDAGDNTNWSLSPYNLFSYAHLGAGLKMNSAPKPCVVDGSHITPGTRVLIESATYHDPYAWDGPERQMIMKLEAIPFIGRCLSHAPGFYWSQLQAIQTGTCQWE